MLIKYIQYIHTHHTCIGDATKIWSEAPEGIKRHPRLTLQKVKQKSIAKLCQFELNHNWKICN